MMRNDQPRPTTSHWADSTDRAGGEIIELETGREE